MAVQLPVITQSSTRAFRKCKRLYRYSYVDMVKPASSNEPLWYGTAWHEVREVWWKQGMSSAFYALRGYMASAPFEDETERDFMHARLKTMLLGYNLRWRDFVAGLGVLGVEQQFAIPLVNPRTGQESRTYQVQGKFDAVVEEDGELWVVEEKTAKDADLGPDSPYWRRLEIDPQSSMYYNAVEKVYGRPCAGVMYFVNVKPALRPKKKTAEVKLKKDGLPYANQQLADETPDEFSARLTEAVAADPERYYRMVRVPRLERDIEESLADVWDTAKEIRHAELSGVWTRNPDACVTYGSTCSYFPVCTRRASIDDPSMYIQLTKPHSELA